jgi:hypothetical protein
VLRNAARRPKSHATNEIQTTVAAESRVVTRLCDNHGCHFQSAIDVRPRFFEGIALALTLIIRQSQRDKQGVTE